MHLHGRYLQRREARGVNRADPRIVMWRNACAAREQLTYAQYNQHMMHPSPRTKIDYKGVQQSNVLAE